MKTIKDFLKWLALTIIYMALGLASFAAILYGFYLIGRWALPNL